MGKAIAQALAPYSCRLLYDQRACPSRTLYGPVIVPSFSSVDNRYQVVIKGDEGIESGHGTFVFLL